MVGIGYPKENTQPKSFCLQQHLLSCLRSRARDTHVQSEFTQEIFLTRKGLLGPLKTSAVTAWIPCPSTLVRS